MDGKAYAEKDFVENPVKYGTTPEVIEYVKKTRNLVEDITQFLCTHADELESMDVVVPDINIKGRLWKQIAEAAPDVYITSSVRQLIEISDKNAGKHTGLRFVTKLLGISMRDVAAFGDGDNDMEMLRMAGCGYAVANASDQCKEAADHIVGHHDADGVGKAILELLK